MDRIRQRRDSLQSAWEPTFPVLDAVVDDAGNTSPGERHTARSGLVLDLSGLTFLDAVGIAALSRICMLPPHGDDLRVLAPTASGPKRLHRLAVDKRWLPATFSPAPTCTHLVYRRRGERRIWSR